MQPIILIGGGGHCKSVIEVIESTQQYQIKGIIDKAELVGSKVLGYEIIGSDADIEPLVKQAYHFHITVGQINSSKTRVSIFNNLKNMQASMPVIIAATATVSKHATLQQGTIVMHHALVNAAASIGENCIVNTGCVIEHDVTVGSNCHISTNCVVNGNCFVQDDCFIGSNATIIQGITIAQQNIIAAGSVVTSNTQSHALYAGVPAMLKKQISA